MQFHLELESTLPPGTEVFSGIRDEVAKRLAAVRKTAREKRMKDNRAVGCGARIEDTSSGALLSQRPRSRMLRDAMGLRAKTNIKPRYKKSPPCFAGRTHFASGARDQIRIHRLHAIDTASGWVPFLGTRPPTKLFAHRSQFRPHVGNVLRSLNSLMFTGFYVR